MNRPRLLYLCYFDPEGISTVPQIIHYMKAGSSSDITVINLFECVEKGESLMLAPTVDFDQYDGIIIHNTISYNPYNMRALDRRTPKKLRDFKGIKVLMKQDENHMMQEVAEYIGYTGIDVIFTCLGASDIPLVYPPAIVGTPIYERMLTGYVAPELRAFPWREKERTIDIGYRGSIQALNFGRLAYEKRQIGYEVSRRLKDTNLRLDISSRWEDRIGGDAWFEFLMRCKGVLGSESGASVFDLNGELSERCMRAEKALGKFSEDEAYAEAYLAYIKDIEYNVNYAQISPRHFEAAACGTLQILHPGHYSGIFIAHKHYFPLERDFSNLHEAVALLQDDEARRKITTAAYEDVIMSPAYWIETFVSRFDAVVLDAMRKKQQGGGNPPQAIATNSLPGKANSMLQMLSHIWVRLPAPVQTRLKPIARLILSRLRSLAICKHNETPYEVVADYWTKHNVTLHKRFSSRQESTEYFHWRCDQYPGYISLMPVSGHDGKAVLDYGCGPGHDIVGVMEYSKPSRLVGCDVSTASIKEAKARVKLHATKEKQRPELMVLDPQTKRLPFADASFDYVHSSGVIHHVPDLKAVLSEFRRILKPGGAIRVMVYNTDSLWMHLYLGYILRLRDKTIPAELPIKQAFTRSTDGPECPIANCYTFEEFKGIAAESGLKATMVGVAASLYEIKLFNEERANALASAELEQVHKDFIQAVEMKDGIPYYHGYPAGIDLVIEMTVA